MILPFKLSKFKGPCKFGVDGGVADGVVAMFYF